MKLSSLFAVALAVALISGCATPGKAPMDPNANLKTEIDLIEAQLQAASHKQYDQLSPKNFERAKAYRGSAMKKMEEGKSPEDVRSDIAVAKHAIQQVENIGNTKGEVLASVLTARQYAVDAQAPNLAAKKFSSAEDDLEDMSEDLEKGKFEVDANDISELQNKYLESEISARKITELKAARDMLEKADHNRAERETPVTFETAKSQIMTAERAIEISPHSSAGYAPAVADANEAALKLTQVLELAKNNNASEQAALTLWEQNEQIQASNAALIKANAAAAEERARLEKAADEERMRLEASAEADRTRLLGELESSQAELASGQATVAALQSKNKQYASEEELKMRIEELRKSFSPDEAEVLKDGKKLVVRLKKIQFNTGRADVKPESFNTLEKVEDLIAAVPTSQVTVEGHTDSTGSNRTNKNLSEKRAENVRKYLESQDELADVPVNSLGFGADRPLTTNKTQKGRATNRRVDIVIETPVVL